MSLIDKISDVANEIAKRYGQDLVDIELGNNKKGEVIKLFVGSKEGVNVTTLASITKEFNKVAEAKGTQFIPYDFQLEVSSPGLDRPLKNWKDFFRNEGRDVRITTLLDNEKSDTFEGSIRSANENEVIIDRGDKDLYKIDFNRLRKAKLVIKF